MVKEKSFPTSLGVCADLAFKMREERMALQQTIKKMEGEEDRLEKHILTLLHAQKTEKAGSKTVTISIMRPRHVRMMDFGSFIAYVIKNKAFDLLEKRAAKLACLEMIDSGKAVPGLDVGVDEKLSITKVGEAQ